MRNRSSKVSLAITVGVILASVCSRRGIADDRLVQFFEGLRARRMFTLAETECLRRLANRDLGQGHGAALTIELSKTYAAHAAYSIGDERAELWDRAAAVVDERLQIEQESAFRTLLTTQRAMVPAARGAQLRWEHELVSLDERRRAEAADVLRDALNRLQPLPEELDAQSRSLASAALITKDATVFPAPSHVYRTRRIVEFTIATASLDLAKVLPVGPDRTSVLLEADLRFEALAKVALPDSIAWQSRVHRLDVMQLRGQGDRLAGQVSALSKPEVPPGVIDAAVAVLIRSHLEADRPDEALAALEEHRQSHGLDDEQLQTLVVEALLAARRIAQDGDQADLAADLLTKAEQIHGRLAGPWQTRTRLLLEQTRTDDRYGRELAKSLREAQSAWQSGDIEKAIQAYSRATSRAHQQGEADLAAELGMKLASAQLESSRFADAVTSLQGFLRAYPDHARAPDADLLRSYVLGRQFEQQPTDDRKEAYRNALEQHREEFAEGATATEAAWMLARLAEHEQDWASALKLFAEVPAEHPRNSAATTRSAIIYERLISAAREVEQDASEWERKAVASLSTAIQHFPRRPEPLNPQQADVSLRLARIVLHRSPPDFSAADDLLKHIIDSGEHIAAEQTQTGAAWRQLVAAASQLRIISLAGQGRLVDARAMLKQVAATQPERMLDILNGLSTVAADIGIEHRANIGRLQLEVAQQLKAQSDTLPKDQQHTLDMALAQAHAALGQWQKAASIYEELLWDDPRDREIVQALATLYEECGSASCLRQAIKQWRTLESLQRKGSVEWLESRYHMAWCSHHVGDTETARKLIGVTRVLYPELGRPSLKALYEALAKDVGLSTSGQK